jgi:hypothetical protein
LDLTWKQSFLILCIDGQEREKRTVQKRSTATETAVEREREEKERKRAVEKELVREVYWER